MGKKRYKSLTGIQYTFPVSVEGKYIWISFKGNENDYATSNTKVQAAIEATDKFKRRMIGLVEGKETNIEPIEPEPTPEVIIPANPAENPETKGDPKPLQTTAYPDVVDINGAVAVLKGEPYKVHYNSLKTPENVLKQAAANNVVFPNWKTE